MKKQENRIFIGKHQTIYTFDTSMMNVAAYMTWESEAKSKPAILCVV